MKAKKNGKGSGELHELAVFFGPQGYCDDCPICQYMKKVEEGVFKFSEEGYIKACLEAEKEGAVIGGPMFDERRDS